MIAHKSLYSKKLMVTTILGLLGCAGAPKQEPELHDNQTRATIIASYFTKQAVKTSTLAACLEVKRQQTQRQAELDKKQAKLDKELYQLLNEGCIYNCPTWNRYKKVTKSTIKCQ